MDREPGSRSVPGARGRPGSDHATARGRAGGLDGRGRSHITPVHARGVDREAPVSPEHWRLVETMGTAVHRRIRLPGLDASTLAVGLSGLAPPRGPAFHQHRCRDRAHPPPRTVGPPLPERRRTARFRRRIPPVHAMAHRGLSAHRPDARRPGPVRGAYSPGRSHRPALRAGQPRYAPGPGQPSPGLLARSRHRKRAATQCRQPGMNTLPFPDQASHPLPYAARLRRRRMEDQTTAGRTGPMLVKQKEFVVAVGVQPHARNVIP